LLKHLCLNHEFEYKTLQAEEAAGKGKNQWFQAMLDNYVQPVTPLRFNHPTVRKITQTIAEMITLDNQPFSMVDDIGFIRVMKVSEPRYTIPGSSHSWISKVSNG